MEELKGAFRRVAETVCRYKSTAVPIIDQTVSMTMTRDELQHNRVCMRYCERHGLPPRIIFTRPITSTAVSTVSSLAPETTTCSAHRRTAILSWTSTAMTI